MELLGTLLRRLVDDEGVPCLTIGVSEETREDITVLERTTELQYRFIQPGPKLTEQEWQACLEAVISLYRRDISAPHDRRARFVVASGSLPPGVPDDFYSQIASAAQRAEARMVVDASGLSLKRALEAGVYLVKPSLSEFRELIGNPMNNETDCVSACRSLIDDGRVEMVALTLGDQGALLVSREQALRAQALAIKPVSVVGAGDSFLGAMIWSLSSGQSIEVAFYELPAFFPNHPDLLRGGVAFFKRWGLLAVFVGRFFGPLRAIVPVVAGLYAMPRIRFQMANLGSAVVWAAGILSPGFLSVRWIVG